MWHVCVCVCLFHVCALWLSLKFGDQLSKYLRFLFWNKQHHSWWSLIDALLKVVLSSDYISLPECIMPCWLPSCGRDHLGEILRLDTDMFIILISIRSFHHYHHQYHHGQHHHSHHHQFALLLSRLVLWRERQRRKWMLRCEEGDQKGGSSFPSEKKHLLLRNNRWWLDDVTINT